MIIGYMVIASKDLDDLVQRVNQRIEQHWQPLGGIGVRKHITEWEFFQAMVLKDEN